MTIRIATRASQLAQWQANHVASLLTAAFPGMAVEMVHVSTTGDRVQSKALSSIGVGVFTREVQAAVLDRRADIAVHSLKDLPTESTPELILTAVPQREVRWDAFVLPAGCPDPQLPLMQLKAGARIGTGSLRRQAQLRHLRTDWQIDEVRGNVDTRLRKLDAGEYDALILASAGLIRLGLSHRITSRLEPPVMYPAVGQGAIGIECRSDDDSVRCALERLIDQTAWWEVLAERSLLAALRAGCHAPVGVHSRLESDQLHLEAVVLSPDGSRKWTATGHAAAQEAVSLGQTIAQQLLDDGADAVLHP